MTDETRDAIPVLSNSVSFEETLAIVRELSELESGIKWSTSPRIILETAFIRICSRELNRDRDDLSERIKFLESRIRSLEERLSGNIEIINRNHVDAPVEGHKESKPEARNDRILDSILIEPETKKIKETASQTGKCDEWGNVIKELKRMGRMAVAANLAETTALWSSSDSIDIQIPNEDEYRKRVLSKLENTDAIKEALKRELGRSINIRIVNMKDEKKTDEREIEDEIPERLRQFVKKKGINLELVDE